MPNREWIVCRIVYFFVIIMSLGCTQHTLVQPGSCESAKTTYEHAVEQTDYEKKVTLYRQILSACPTYAEARNNLGFFARRLEKVYSRLTPPMPVEPGVGPIPARSHAD